MQEKKEKFDKKIKHYQCLYQFCYYTSVKFPREYLEENKFDDIDFIYNNSYEYDNRIIVGTRGWQDGKTSEDKRLIKRENFRLELSLKNGVKKYGDDKKIIVCMHYPPFNNYEELDMNYIKTMKKYNVSTCIYGHLHGETAHKEVKEGDINEIDFKMVSCDYTDFDLIQLK